MNKINKSNENQNDFAIRVAAHGDTTIAYVIKNSLWHMVEQGIGGIIIAFLYGRDITFK